MAAPPIKNVSFPASGFVGRAFHYGATVGTNPWTTIVSQIAFGDGSIGPLSGNKTYHSAGTFHPVFTAADPFGDKSAVTRTIRVIAPPNTAIVSSDVNSAHRRATFGFKAIGSPATGFQCALVKLHAGTAPQPHYSACTSPKKYTQLAKGRYRFFVRARNAAGPDPTPATHGFTI